jgi:glutaredoxin 3
MTNAVEVVMYSTAWCPYCDRARALLKRKGVSYTEIKVDEEPEQRAAMLQRSGGRRSVPQIFIGTRHIGGYDDMYALDRAGELDSLLGLEQPS